MQALELMERLMSRNANVTPLRPAPKGPARRAWDAFEEAMSELARQQQPLVELVEKHAHAVDAATALRRAVEDARSHVMSLRADQLNNDADAVTVAAGEQELLSLRARLADVEHDAEIAALAQQRAQVKLNAVTAHVQALQAQRYGLLRNLILERLEHLAPAYQAALDGYVNVMTEASTLSAAADRLMRFIPGAQTTGGRFAVAIELPSPDAPGYEGMSAPRDLARPSRDAATALLREYGVHAPP
jgi:chromosome segregation ATPase